MMKIAANPIDVQDLQFKLQCNLKIFDDDDTSTTQTARNLVAAASRFGLVFVGCNRPLLKVIRFVSIEEYVEPSNSEFIDNFSRREFELHSIPRYVSVNCDHTKLAIVIEKNNCSVVQFYDVQSFVKDNVVLLSEVRISLSGVEVVETNWHPTIADIFTECQNNGSLGIYQLKGSSVDINRLPPQSNATCFCWSPKGKQIAVGSKDGKITHYKPDLKAVKCISPPPFEKQYSIISLQWISTYQFIGIFKPLEDPSEQSCLVLIDAPKTGTPVFTNFFDVCYSSGKIRPPQFYMIFEHHWNILMVASANSMEVGVLACSGETWDQWTLLDSARAALPLDKNHEDTYPVGMAIDTSSVKPIPWGESSLQPAPSLLLLSHQGILCCFKIINLKEGAPNVNSPPENMIDLSGLGKFTTGSAKALKRQEEIPKEIATSIPQIVSQNIQQPPSQKTQAEKDVKTAQNIIIATPFAQVQKPAFMSNSQQVTITPTQKTAQLQSSPTANLFGGQVTITPVVSKDSKQNSSTSMIGSMLLSNINSGPSPILQPSSRSGNIPTSQMLTQQTLASPQQPPASAQKPLVSTQQAPGFGQTQNATKPETTASEDPIHTPIKPQNKTQATSILEISKKQPQEDNKEVETILAQMIQMECSALENELKSQLFLGEQIKINLDRKDMDVFASKTKDIEDFIKELNEICESQDSEIQMLKQNTFQAWGWLEEARSRFGESKNEEIDAVLKSRPLDSLAEKHLSTLKQLEYYLDSQMGQANKALDEQWDIFQEYCRNINRSQMPTMETIFQTMVKQKAVLQKHEYVLKDLSSRIKGGQNSANHTDLFSSVKEEQSLEESFRNLKLEPKDIDRIYYRKVMNRVKSLPHDTVQDLRKMLVNREISHVKIKSQTASSVLQSTPVMKTKSITVHMTPTTTEQPEVVRNLNFFQSTPLTSAQVSSSAFVPTNTVSLAGKSQVSSFLAKFDSEKPAACFGGGKSEVGQTSASSSFFSGMPKSSSEQPKTISAGQSTPKAFFTPQSTQGSLFTANKVTGNENVAAKNSNTSFPGFTSQSSQSSLFSANKITGNENVAVQNSNTSFPGFTLQSPQSSPFGANKLTGNDSATVKNPPSSTVNITSSIFMKPIQSPSVTSGASGGSAVSFVSSSSKSEDGIVDLSKTSSSNTSSTSSLFTKTATTASTASSQSVTSTKPSFFTPISSTQPVSATSIPQQSSFFSSSKASVVSPAITAVKSPISAVTSTVSAPIMPKAVSSEANNSNTSQTFSIFSNKTSEASKTSIFSTPVTTSSVLNSGSLFGASGGFSFLAASQNSGSTTVVTTQSPSTAFSPVSGSAPSTTAAPASSSSVFVSSSVTSDKPVPSTSQNLFGASVASSSAPITTQAEAKFGAVSSPFATSSANKSAFATISSGSIFGAPARSTVGVTSSAGSTSIFAPAVTSSVAASTSVFAPPVTASEAAVTSVFAAPVKTFATTTATSSPFTNVPLFGSNAYTTNNTTSSSIFGNPASFNSAPTFGTVSSTNSLFGSPMTTTSTAPIFGATTAFGATSPFGNTPTSSSPFGAAPISTPSIFGTASVSTSSPFGSNSTSTSTPFGSGAVNVSSPFGTAASSFGGVTTTASSPFAAPSTSTTSPFGQSNVFGKPVFGSSATSSSAFGQSSSSVFGSSTSSNVFGATTTTPSFGSTASPFGAASPTSNTSPFGQTSSTSGVFGSSQSIFGSSGNTETGSFGFGSLNVGGSNQQSPFAKVTETKSPFGSSTFNTTSNTGSLFGSSSFGNTGGGSVFGQSSFGSGFGSGAQSGPFSGGSGTVAQSGFGAAATPPKQGGFGAQPTFGGSPAFGAAPTFGGSPAFGGGATFGNVNKVFGSSSPTGVFGSANQQSNAAGFGTFASQNTIGFGNLAQQSSNNNGQNAPFGGSSSFSNWR